MSHLYFLGGRRVTCSNFLTEDPHFCSALRNALLSDAVCSVRVNRYTFVRTEKKL